MPHSQIQHLINSQTHALPFISLLVLCFESSVKVMFELSWCHIFNWYGWEFSSHWKRSHVSLSCILIFYKLCAFEKRSSVRITKPSSTTFHLKHYHHAALLQLWRCNVTRWMFYLWKAFCSECAFDGWLCNRWSGGRWCSHQKVSSPCHLNQNKTLNKIVEW